MAKRGPKSKIDWENIPVKVVYDDEPNEGNPYDSLRPEVRRERLLELYLRVYLRGVEE